MDAQSKWHWECTDDAALSPEGHVQSPGRTTLKKEYNDQDTGTKQEGKGGEKTVNQYTSSKDCLTTDSDGYKPRGGWYTPDYKTYTGVDGKVVYAGSYDDNGRFRSARETYYSNKAKGGKKGGKAKERHDSPHPGGKSIATAAAVTYYTKKDHQNAGWCMTYNDVQGVRKCKLASCILRKHGTEEEVYDDITTKYNAARYNNQS